MFTISAKYLSEIGACKEGIKLFKQFFGNKKIRIDTEDADTFIFLNNYFNAQDPELKEYWKWIRKYIYRTYPKIFDKKYTQLDFNSVDTLVNLTIEASDLHFINAFFEFYTCYLFDNIIEGNLTKLHLYSCRIRVTDFRGILLKSNVYQSVIGYSSFEGVRDSVFYCNTVNNSTFHLVEETIFTECVFSGVKFKKLKNVIFNNCIFIDCTREGSYSDVNCIRS